MENTHARTHAHTHLDKHKHRNQLPASEPTQAPEAQVVHTSLHKHIHGRACKPAHVHVYTRRCTYSRPHAPYTIRMHVVYVSQTRNESQFNKYRDEMSMPWLLLPFSSDARATLRTAMKVSHMYGDTVHTRTNVSCINPPTTHPHVFTDQGPAHTRDP